MTNIVAFDARQHAREVKNRLWNPNGGRASSELEIISGSELRQRKERERLQREEMARAEADFRRATVLDDIMRKALAEHIKLKEIAHKILIEDNFSPRPKIRMIIARVAEFYGVTPTDILSHRRTAAVVLPRQVAMYIARTVTFKSMPEIGKDFSNRDHTTVLHAARKIDRLLREGDRELARAITEISEGLGS